MTTFIYLLMNDHECRMFMFLIKKYNLVKEVE